MPGNVGRLTARTPCPILGIMDADRIKAIRRHYGLSQERFAFLLGVSRNSVIRWESGVAPPHSLSVRRQLMRLEVAGDEHGAPGAGA